MNGWTVRRRSPSAKTCGFISTTVKATTLSASSAGSITRITPKRWNTCWSAHGTLNISPPVVKQPKPFVLPPKNDTMRRVFAYLLNHRGIDRDVLCAFVRKGMVYESADYHKVVFVGYDQNGVARHAHKRGTGSKKYLQGKR